MTNRNSKHLGSLEIEIIEAGHRNGIDAHEIAKNLGCSDRAVRARYMALDGIKRRKKEYIRAIKIEPRPRPKADKASRHYRSNFEPS